MPGLAGNGVRWHTHALVPQEVRFIALLDIACDNSKQCTFHFINNFQAQVTSWSDMIIQYDILNNNRHISFQLCCHVVKQIHCNCDWATFVWKLETFKVVDYTIYMPHA